VLSLDGADLLLLSIMPVNLRPSYTSSKLSLSFELSFDGRLLLRSTLSDCTYLRTWHRSARIQSSRCVTQNNNLIPNSTLLQSHHWFSSAPSLGRCCRPVLTETVLHQHSSLPRTLSDCVSQSFSDIKPTVQRDETPPIRKRMGSCEAYRIQSEA
jgi:hypothetical protein